VHSPEQQLFVLIIWKWMLILRKKKANFFSLHFASPILLSATKSAEIGNMPANNVVLHFGHISASSSNPLRLL
jgi:hypothetical protein